MQQRRYWWLRHTIVLMLIALFLPAALAQPHLYHAPLDPSKVRVLDAHMDHPGAWVSSLSPTRLEMETGLLVGGGDTMTATLRLVTASDIPDGTVVDARLAYRWEDEAGGGSGLSNRVTLTKGSSDLSQEVYPLLADGMTNGADGALHFRPRKMRPHLMQQLHLNRTRPIRNPRPSPSTPARAGREAHRHRRCLRERRHCRAGAGRAGAGAVGAACAWGDAPDRDRR